jgi:putative ABC transport system substrate-binding protein
MFAEPFLSSMKRLGWDEDHGYRVLILGTEGHNDQYPALIGELVAKRVNVIVVFGNPGIDAARRATAATPTVGTTDDLVNSGFAASMTRPGGNITGVSIFGSELDVKRLELLHEAVPAAKRIGVLADPTGSRGRIEDAGRSLHLELALQLQFLDGSESMGDHDSGFDDWWSVGRRYADAVGFFAERGQATDSSAVYAGSGRDLGWTVSRWTVEQRGA